MHRTSVHLALSGLASILASGSLLAAPAKPLAQSPVLTSQSPQRLVDLDVPLKDAKELYLVVSAVGDISCDWADWIDGGPGDDWIEGGDEVVDGSISSRLAAAATGLPD